MAEGLPGVEVISEGLRGRLTAFDQTAAPADANGARALPILLHSHAPLDLVMVMLGSNDIYFGMDAYRAADGLQRIVEIIRGHAWRMDAPQAPDIMLIAPPPMVAGPDPIIDADTIARSIELVANIHAKANDMGCHFFDAGQVSKASPVDGIHLDPYNTRAIGLALQAPVAAILERRARLA